MSARQVRNIPDYKRRVASAAAALDQAECIAIGGGAGLSDAAGLHYTGRRFTDNFAPFIARYGSGHYFADMYTSSFYPFPTQEEKWAYWARHISLNRYETGPTELYRELFQLMRDKDYFVLTTNVDAQFQKAGFPETRIFAVQGDYGYFQCARGCHDSVYANQREVAAMLRRTSECRIPRELIPACPACNGPMDVHVHKDQYFVRDTHWQETQKDYADFLRASAGKRLLLLELGVGFNTPGIVRYPFEELAHANPKAILVRINLDHPRGAAENASRTITFTEDMSRVVSELYSHRNKLAPKIVD